MTKSLFAVVVAAGWLAVVAGANAQTPAPAPAATPADCKAEKTGLANAVKKRHAPMALATATYSWAECERGLLETMTWPAKTVVAKLQAEIGKRQKQLGVVQAAYSKAAASNSKDPRWKILGAFGVGRAALALAQQLRRMPMPAAKPGEDRAAVETAFKDAIATAAKPYDAASVTSFQWGLDSASKSAAKVAGDAEVQTGIKHACGALAQMKPPVQHASCAASLKTTGPKPAAPVPAAPKPTAPKPSARPPALQHGRPPG